MPTEYMFCLTCGEQCIKSISSLKKCGLFSSVFKKIIPNNTTPIFNEWVGYLNFVSDMRTSHGIAKTITKLIFFDSQDIFTFFVCHGFQ